ncbi:ribbon-helix-helix domain-containing protein [Methylobacterium gossipiicola]|uniref:Antitoxin-like ribbon-helix-helix domain-containing protein n=1 Tax=Methylobacterium gossipiicola TaxID=582675 RepID=A0A1I2VXI3_9HYPH|nr:ribbon-helix-helix domain-containing protein [Methylobacterium gossipiicola]SFG93844.1 hypothetical protein SAMN05192565_11838 [Methylobacterium gossipiicola]
MSKPPKPGLVRPNLASIVAASTATSRPLPSAEIVKLDVGTPRSRPSTTLKERARQMSVYLEPPVYDQLRDIAHAERAKMHGLMLEALDLLFKQRGARSIRHLTDGDSR